MHLHINHVFCLDSIWGGMYDCRYLVDFKKVLAGNSYYDEPNPDWTNLVERKPFFDEKEYEQFRNNPKLKHIDKEVHKTMCQKQTVVLKPEVLAWLKENIKERKDKGSPQGWCIGTDAYNSINSLSLSIFFHRKRDALAFIKKWSIHSKPTTYFDYFKNVRKELNLKTKKLELVSEFTKL